MNQNTRDLLELHFLVVLWGFTAVLGLLINLPALEIVLFRTLISTVALAIWLKVIGVSFTVVSKDLWQLLGIGLIFGAHWILFFLSAKVSNASMCLAGMATAAVWTAVLEPIFDRKRMSLLEITLSLVCVIGLILVLNVEFDRALGLLLAVGSAFLTALFTIANRRQVKIHHPFKIMFYEMTGAFLGTLGFILVYNPFNSKLWINLSSDFTDWAYLTFLAVVCTVYAYTMSVKLLKRLSAFTVNFIVNLEPVYGIVLAFLILGKSEIMGLGFYLGTLIVLMAVLVYPFLKRKTLSD